MEDETLRPPAGDPVAPADELPASDPVAPADTEGAGEPAAPVEEAAV